VGNRWTKQKISIPKTFRPKERIAIATAIIERIVTRTQEGLDRNDTPFKKYSKKYAALKGVGVDDVDLVLTGEMLLDLEMVNHKNGEITIGYKSPSEELAGKVKGNRTGSYGDVPNKKKARDYLGISESDLNLIIDGGEAIADDSSGFDINALLDQLILEEFI